MAATLLCWHGMAGLRMARRRRATSRSLPRQCSARPSNMRARRDATGNWCVAAQTQGAVARSVSLLKKAQS